MVEDTGNAIVERQVPIHDTDVLVPKIAGKEATVGAVVNEENVDAVGVVLDTNACDLFQQRGNFAPVSHHRV